MKTYALLIGINQYHPDSGVSSLSGCKNDVRFMQNYLEKNISQDLNLITLHDKNATYQNIVKHFGKHHLLQANEGDLVLIQYSGHGAREKAAPEFAAYFQEEKQETMVCYDSRLPGHYDLADKELAVLIERIASKGAQVVLILDCCHSGSGTRNMADITLGKSRQWDDSNKVRPIESYLDGHFVNNLYLPNSKHILMAACEKREKAYELVSNRGSFSKHLMQVLEEQEGKISYANLFAQLRILMRKITDKQTPQFETSGFFNAHTTFLGNANHHEGTTYQVFCKDDNWQVEAGAINGIAATASGKATFELFNEGQSIGQANSITVKLNTSTIDPNCTLDTKKIYQAQLTSIPSAPIIVNLKASAANSTNIKDALSEFKPIYFELLEDMPNAPYRLEIENDVIKIIRTVDDLLIRTVIGLHADAYQDIFEKLEHLNKWEKSMALENNAATHRRDVELVLKELDSNNNVVRETTDNEVIIDILKQDNKEQLVPFRLEAKNHSSSPWHCALLYFSENYGVYKMYNEEVPANSTTIIVEKDEKGKTYKFELNGKNEATDIFKLIVSKERINDYSLTQKAFKIGEVIEPTRSPQLSGQSKGIGHEEDDAYQEESFQDWFTITIKCKSIAQQASVGDNDITISNGAIKVLGNDSGFKANIALASTSIGTRSIASLPIIPELLANQDVTLVNLGTATRSTTPSNMLILQDIQDSAQLKEQPLQIELNTALENNERILPITFDGEHIIPVGQVAELDNGNTLVSINKIPDLQEERRRSLGKALKLCFLKLVLRQKDVQQLRWVDYSLPDIERRTEGIVTKVRDANNILVVIHGIIGDTKGIAACMRQAYEDKTFDLVLSFDYENLNTKIEETADALRKKLDEVGLDEASGKSITILAHSMGGLVSRYFIEKLGGQNRVKHLIMAGTPNAGSAIAKVTQYRDWGITLLGLAMNTPWGIPAAATLMTVLKKSSILTPTLEQMNPDNAFIKQMENSTYPNIPYSIIAGHLDQHLEKNPDAKKLMDKLYKLGAKAFYGNQSNDIAVSVNSILTIPQAWNPTTKNVACHHLNYFVNEESVKELYAALTT